MICRQTVQRRSTNAMAISAGAANASLEGAIMGPCKFNVEAVNFPCAVLHRSRISAFHWSLESSSWSDLHTSLTRSSSHEDWRSPRPWFAKFRESGTPVLASVRASLRCLAFSHAGA